MNGWPVWRSVDDEHIHVLPTIQVKRALVFSGPDCCTEQPIPGRALARVSRPQHDNSQSVRHFGVSDIVLPNVLEAVVDELRGHISRL